MGNTKKIYIHHNYSKSLFYKLFHNTSDIVIDDNDDSVNVKCKYNDTDLELIFDRNINDNTDGYHLLDWFSIYGELHNENPKILYDRVPENHDFVINNEIQKIVENKTNWIISILRTEKIYKFDYETLDKNLENKEAQEIYDNLCSKHYMITDNFYLMDVSDKLKFNHVLTNTLFEWNSMIDIRWFYEFKNIFEKLNFDYDLGFSIRNAKPSRLRLMEELLKMENDKMFLQISEFKVFQPNLENSNFFIKDSIIEENNQQKLVIDLLDKYPQIKTNKPIGETHFSDLTILNNGWNRGIDYDLFFRYLYKAKVQILDESWAFYNGNFPTQYLSEKTIGYILSKVPFIPTNVYPIQYIKNELEIEYPFYNEIKSCNANTKKLAEFIKWFMDDFDSNYNLLKEWTELLHTTYMNKINNENSLIDLIISDFTIESSVKKNKTLL